MSFLSFGKNLVSNLAANTVNRFNSLINSYVYEGADNMQSTIGLANLSDGSTGASHVVDIMKKMSDIEWSRGYSWDVHLSPAPPPPFDGSKYGLPVVEVQSDFSLMGESVDLPLANSTYRAPIRKNFFDIKLTLLDSYNGVLEQYFESWMNSIYSWDGTTPLNGRINYLDKSVKTLSITKLTSTKKAIFTRRYLVYPEANMSSFDNSQGTVRSFTVNLVVAGYLGKDNSTSVLGSGDSFVDKIKSSYTPKSIESDSWSSYSAAPTIDVLQTENSYTNLA